MAISDERLRELIATDEGQYHDLKSLFEGPPGQKRPRDRREVRDQIAEQVAGFANADGGVAIFGVEDNAVITGHAYPHDAVQQMLAVPRARLIPPQVAGAIRVLAGWFRVVLQNTPIFQSTDPEWSRAVRELPIEVSQKRALVALGDREFVNADYCDLNGVDRDTAYRELQELIARGLLQTSGTGAGLRYRVVRASVPRPPSELAATPRDVLARRMETAGFITNADYREAFGVDRYVAKHALARWVTSGILILEGERRGARYRLGPRWPP